MNSPDLWKKKKMYVKSVQPLSSLQELTHLAQLPQLRHLSLKDPQSIPNPLCMLYNYYIHVLYHMPHLQRLDTYDIYSKHLKDTAEVRESLFHASESVSFVFENDGNVWLCISPQCWRKRCITPCGYVVHKDSLMNSKPSSGSRGKTRYNYQKREYMC